MGVFVCPQWTAFSLPAGCPPPPHMMAASTCFRFFCMLKMCVLPCLSLVLLAEDFEMKLQNVCCLVGFALFFELTVIKSACFLYRPPWSKTEGAQTRT